jgi:hypothetical protein
MVGRGNEGVTAAPRSPLGTGALLPAPSWYFAGDVLAVEFWRDPDVSANILPTRVELDKESPGHSVAIFKDYQFTAQNDEYLDLARYKVPGSASFPAMRRGADIAVSMLLCRQRGCFDERLDPGLFIRNKSGAYTGPARSPSRVQLRRNSRMVAGSPPACPRTANCY